MSFIMTNRSPDRVKILPNDATREKVVLGYKDVRTKYIDFVKKYNASKMAGTITLNSDALEALKVLNNLWKTATADSDYFFDMDEHHDKLNGKFPAEDDIVSAAWNNYVQVYSDWLSVLLRSRATMFQVQL